MATDSDLNFLLSKRMQTFLTFCQIKNVQETAKALGLSDSSVSRHLFEIEDEFGVDLIDRKQKPLVPNTEGIQLANSVRRQISPIREIAGSLRRKNSLYPAFRFGVLQTYSVNVAPLLIEKMKPLVSSTLCLTGPSERLLTKFITQNLDAILASQRYSTMKGLRRHMVFFEPMVLLVPRSFPLPRKIDWQFMTYCGLPYIRMYRESSGKLPEDYFSSIGFSFPNSLEIDNTGVVVSLVSKGLGWSIIRPSSLLQYRSFLDGLTMVPMPEPRLTRGICLIDHPSFYKELHEKVVAECLSIFRDTVIPELLEWMPWLKGMVRTGSLKSPG